MFVRVRFYLFGGGFAVRVLVTAHPKIESRCRTRCRTSKTVTDSGGYLMPRASIDDFNTSSIAR
jgi:hypothetical protein